VDKAERKQVRSALLCDDPHCMYCGKYFDSILVWPSGRFMPTIEHIVPRFQGGTDEMHNLGLSCYPCNQLGSVVRDI